MWEDNNPLSYDRRSSTSSFHHPTLSPPASNDSHTDEPPDFLTHQPQSSSEHSQDEFEARPLDDEDDEGEEEEYRQQRREGGYSSRVEQALMEDKDIEIRITDAGKNSEGSGGYIVYTIRTRGVCSAALSVSLSHNRPKKLRNEELTISIGPRGTPSLLRIRISSQESRFSTPLFDCSSNPGKASSIRLRCSAHECKRECEHH